MDKTRLFRGSQTGNPCLAAFHTYGHIGDYFLTGRTSLGRIGGRADIGLPVPTVSGRHGEFGCAEGHWFYRDLGSTNGTRVNGIPLTEVREMQDGDVLTVVPKDETNAEPAFAGVFIRLEPEEELIWRRIALEPDMPAIRIGRAESGLSPDDEALSARHAVFRMGADGLFILDEGSLNGVYVNGKRCENRRLGLLDVVRLGRTCFVVTDGCLWEGEIRQKAAAGYERTPYASGQEAEKRDRTAENAGLSLKEAEKQDRAAANVAGNAGISLKEAEKQTPEVPEKRISSPVEVRPDKAVGAEAEPNFGAGAVDRGPVDRPAFAADLPRLIIDIDERSVKKNFKKRVLLEDIHVAVAPGDMVLILGGSGAGKTTFMRSVMGYDRAEGTIRYGDKDVYEDYETMKREIGYVPQQDLVRMGDSVGDTLMAAARIRMPGDSSLREQTERVDWLVDILGLAEERNNLIGAISGGQRKRVSIGIELAADPALFFLDEPDSGLDGVMARGLMEKLKVIADLGKIVLVITHTPDRAIDLFTKVLVLGKTEDNVGHLLFYGRPDEALSFFGTDKLENIVHRINRESEGGEGLADYFHERFKGEKDGEK